MEFIRTLTFEQAELIVWSGIAISGLLYTIACVLFALGIIKEGEEENGTTRKL